ncbi:prominin-2-like [Hemitrygon akajei]|uniref:prominin-2-like n=1 Tax=Hemitrygon akajei TaxID=2704970 RepID=UPI003BF96FFA
MGLHGRRMDFLLITMAAIFLSPHPIASQDCVANTLRFSNLSLLNFNRLDGDAGTIEPLYNMVNLYLDAVQPNEFPKDVLQRSIKDPNYIAQNYEKVLRYEAGYIVSLILGVLFFVFMPLVGFIFCCCRVCGKCGGQVKDRTQHTDCQRHTYATFLLMTTIIILAGVACAFTANQKVTDAMEPSVSAFRRMLADVASYIDNILEAIPKVIAQFSVPKNKIFSEFDRVSNSLGFTLKGALNPIVYPVLEMASARLKDFNTMKGHLDNIKSVNSSLAETQRELSRELSILQGEISNTLNDPNCQRCKNAVRDISNLEVDPTYTLPADDQVVFNEVMSFSLTSLNNSVEQASRTFNETPATVTDQATRTFTDIKKLINDIERNLSSAVEAVQFPDSLRNLENFANSSTVTEISSEVKRYDYYRWVVSIVLCCIILLIIACNVLGLGLGTAGIATRDDVYRGNACSKSGANFLMAGVGFSFIFSWLLILLVFVTFFVGGNIQTLVCKPWKTGEIYEVADDLAQQNNIFNISNFFRQSVTYSSLYRHCEEGKSLWLVLPQSQISKLEEYLNVSTYTGDIVQNSRQLNVDLSRIVLLGSSARSNLMEFANSGIDQVNFTDIIESINNKMSMTPLLDFAARLENLSQIQSNLTIRSKMTEHAQKLRALESTLANRTKPEQAQLNASFQYLASFAPGIRGLINNTIQRIDTAQEAITTTVKSEIEKVRECLIIKQLGYFIQYLQWIRTMVMDNLLSCQPPFILVNNVRVILCDNITEPWNAFWFCLGWCTLFLIPSIIFAVKTAKHYRSIKNADKSPEFSEMMQFKFPRVANTYGPPLSSVPSVSTN